MPPGEKENATQHAEGETQRKVMRKHQVRFQKT